MQKEFKAEREQNNSTNSLRKKMFGALFSLYLGANGQINFVLRDKTSGTV